jgi:hypothetical protein
VGSAASAARVAAAPGPPAGPAAEPTTRSRRSLPVRTRIVLRSLAVFNGGLLVVLGALSLRYVDGAAGPIGAAGFWCASAALFAIARRVGRETEWG